MNTPLKILIVEDHHLVRDGIARALGLGEGNVKVVFADSCRGALECLMANSDLDLILLDLGLPDGDGFECLEKLRACDDLVPIMIVSANCAADNIKRALEAGARGYIPKRAGTDVLLGAIQLVLSGGIYIPPETLASKPQNEIADLTPRQRDVLLLLRDGMSNKEIGNKLGMAEATVRQHVTAIFRALGVSNRTEAALKARTGY